MWTLKNHCVTDASFWLEVFGVFGFCVSVPLIMCIDIAIPRPVQGMTRDADDVLLMCSNQPNVINAPQFIPSSLHRREFPFLFAMQIMPCCCVPISPM